MPQNNIDPVLITSLLIVSLQQVISRHTHPAIPAVLSFGKVIADGATNVIPNEVKIEGTFRTLDEKFRERAHQLIKDMADKLVKSMGGECDLRIEKGYPCLINDEELTDTVKGHAIEYLGKDNVVDLDIWMAAEDFSYYTHKIPGCLYRLGVGNEKRGITSSVHTSTFDVDEQALETGMGLMAWLAVKKLE